MAEEYTSVRREYTKLLYMLFALAGSIPGTMSPDTPVFLLVKLYKANTFGWFTPPSSPVNTLNGDGVSCHRA